MIDRLLIAFFALGLLIFVGCKEKPKVISVPEDNRGTQHQTGIFSETPSPHKPAFTNDLHTVKVEDVLQTPKYVYLHVQEGNKRFWIATAKQDVYVGETYFYRGGLLKTNFESKEYNRIFDTVYLVSKLVGTNHGTTSPTPATASDKVKEPSQTPPASVINHGEGVLRIADLVAYPDKYDGKTVMISGRCSKVNPNIMGRNWIHLKDGSQDDFDLVVTSDIAIPEGQSVTMTATVVLNKDFGAGYRYDIILENGKIAH